MREKESLISFVEYVTQVSKSKFSINDIISFVLEYHDFTLKNQLGNHFVQTREYTCYIGVKSIPDKLETFLANFLSKAVFQSNEMISLLEGDYYLLYWGEGENFEVVHDLSHIMPDLIITIEDLKENKIVEDPLKVTTILPGWLDDFIFSHLNGKYEPDYVRFLNNFDLTDDELKKYLGTYFPRSYAESFCIFSDLFNNGKVYQALPPRIRILDFGSGTGGNIIGFLLALNKAFLQNFDIEIISIDAHEKALDLQRAIIDKYSCVTKKKIELKIFKATISTHVELKDLLREIKGTFTFIMTFKCLSEIISNYPKPLANAYSIFVSELFPRLEKNGLMVILDVTVKVGDFYIPVILNKQVSSSQRENSDIRTLIPAPCFHYGHFCTFSCFTQQQFVISHSTKNKIMSKVTYRVLGHNEYVTSLVGNSEKAKYVVKWATDLSGRRPLDLCIHSLASDQIKDGFKL